MRFLEWIPHGYMKMIDSSITLKETVLNFWEMAILKFSKIQNLRNERHTELLRQTDTNVNPSSVLFRISSKSSWPCRTYLPYYVRSPWLCFSSNWSNHLRGASGVWPWLSARKHQWVFFFSFTVLSFIFDPIFFKYFHFLSNNLV